MTSFTFNLTQCNQLWDFVNSHLKTDIHQFSPFIINQQQLGFLNQQYKTLLLDDLADFCSETDHKLYLDSASWPHIASLLQNIGWEWFQRSIFGGWRHENFQVYDEQQNPLFALERALFRPFGLISHAVHLNGLVVEKEQMLLWIAKRSPYKAVDPNKLDNIVGGGVTAGESIHHAMIRESFEEAGIPAHLLQDLSQNDCCLSCRAVHRGLHREYLHLYDVILPADFQPQNQDGEVSSFTLMSVEEIAEAIINGDFMNDASLATLNLFNRLNYFPINHPITSWLQQCNRA